MKKFIFSLLALFSGILPGYSQQPVRANTILSQDFNTEPVNMFIPAPNGSDQSWVNYDADNQPTYCGAGTPVPGGWFWEGSFEKDAPSTEYAMTSCSYFNLMFPNPNNNWLILPPVPIPDAGYTLKWESMPFNGPAWMDGYEVLISTGSNDPNDEEYTSVFKAAEMTHSFDVDYLSLDLDDYLFSDGYIHADSYSNSNYFDLDTGYTDDGQLVEYYRGRFQPHSISLAEYSGQTIYIAFVHNSNNDYLLQLDNIVISDSITSTQELPSGVQTFEVLPNPVRSHARVQLEIDFPEDIQLELFDLHGQRIWQTRSKVIGAGAFNLDLETQPAGIYTLKLTTPKGIAARKIIKS
jgi:hypothetical protein